MKLLSRVRDFIRQHDLIRPGARVVAAVSGGSDSVALACLLAELDRAGELSLVAVAHFNHQLRPAADADEQFVGDLARSLDRPAIADRADVASRAQRERQSIERAARAARYEFFERVCTDAGAESIALGHTRDDQAETFLLRLLRGAGPRGLASMHPRHGAVVRPLLGCRRDDLRAWLDARGIPYVEDETNRDVAIPRNRVRAELLPLLSERFNPAIVDALADEAELQQEQWNWLVETSAPHVARFDRARGFDVVELSAWPAAVRRVVVWQILAAAAHPRQISFDHVAAVLRLMQVSEGSVDVPGLTVQRNGTRIVLQVGSRASRGSRTNLFRHSLSIPGEVEIPEAACVVSVEADNKGMSEAVGRAAMGNGDLAVVRHDLVHGSLAVRNRRPGDRFRPVGLHGWKKLQDLFVDRKIARQDRDAVPIVVDENDRIVWVAGFGIDEAFRVTDPAQAVLLLRLTRALRRGDPGFVGGSA